MKENAPYRWPGERDPEHEPRPEAYIPRRYIAAYLLIGAIVGGAAVWRVSHHDSASSECHDSAVNIDQTIFTKTCPLGADGTVQGSILFCKCRSK